MRVHAFVLGGAMLLAVVGDVRERDAQAQSTTLEIPEIGGAKLGAKLSELETKWKAAGHVVRSKKTRKGAGGKTATVVRVELKGPGELGGLRVTAKDDEVYAIRGFLKTEDADRIVAFQKKFGNPRYKRSTAYWSRSDEKMLFLGSGGKWVAALDVKRANQLMGTNVKPFEETPPPAPTPPRTLIDKWSVIGGTSEQLEVQIKLDSIKCFAEVDLGWGDEPELRVIQLHTNPTLTVPDPAFRKLTWSDVQHDETRDIDERLLTQGRTVVAAGEAVGFSATLFEHEPAFSFYTPTIPVKVGVDIPDTEVDAVMDWFPYHWLKAKAGGPPQTFWQDFQMPGARYRLTYTITIGKVTAVPVLPSGFPTAILSEFDGDYEVFHGGVKGTAKLIKAPAHPSAPAGSLMGTMTSGTTTYSVQNLRLVGSHWEAHAFAGDKSFRIVGYLGGDKTPLIAGTAIYPNGIRTGITFKQTKKRTP